jgi:hypothetical protein
MKYTDLSPLAQSIWDSLNELEAVTNLTISEMAYDSSMDWTLSPTRQRAYMEVYEYASQPPYEQQ